MGPEVVIALDQGTTSCRAIVFDRQGRVQGVAQKPLAQHYPQPGWVEHDPQEILRIQLSVLSEALAGARVEPGQVKAIGITNQRETVVLWDRQTGRPVHNAIVWQCRRTAPFCTALKAQGLEPAVMARTGLRLDAYFSASKIRWLLDHVPEARALAAQGRLLAGTMDSWLIWNLSGRQAHVTDRTNASRTLLVDIRTGEYAPDMLELFGVSADILPRIVPSSGIAAWLDEAILPGRIPIAGIAGDQHAALFGQACFTPGMVKNTYGTGCFIVMQTGREPVFSRNGLLTTIAYDLGDGPFYALEGSVFNAGSAIQWLRDQLGLIATAAECDRLAEQVSNTGGIHFVPAFTGLGAPHWSPDTRGTLTGITRGTSRAHMARAVLEAIAFQSLDVIECMAADAGCAIPELRVDGGASVSDILMQFQSDLLEIPVDRPRNVETTAFGAAALAGLAVGFYPDLAAVSACRESDRVFRPEHDAAWRRARLKGWRHAVATAIADSRHEADA